MSGVLKYISWKFKCLSCGYKFKAIEPDWLFKKFGDSCWQCGSKDIEKTVITEDFKYENDERDVQLSKSALGNAQRTIR